MKIFCVLVTFNRADMLRRTLDELLAQGFRHVVLVDNASTDDTPSVIQSFQGRFDRFHVVRMDHNTGGAGGFERGMQEFLQMAGDDDYALLHDDDSWPAFDCASLLAHLEAHGVQHGCFPVIYPDGELNQMNIPGDADLLRRPLRYMFSARLRAERRPRALSDFESQSGFDYAGFVGYLIRKAGARRVGVPSAAFFIYSDDTTYTYLASRKLGPIANLGAGGKRFVHDCKRSTGRSLLTGRFAGYEVRNKVIFLRIGSPTFHPLLSLVFLAKCLVLAPGQWRTIGASFLAGYRAPLARYLPQGGEA